MYLCDNNSFNFFGLGVESYNIYFKSMYLNIIIIKLV